MVGLCASPSSSGRSLLLLLPMLLEDTGRLPLAFPEMEIVSLGGVPTVSEPCEEGDERLAERVRLGGGMC